MGSPGQVDRRPRGAKDFTLHTALGKLEDAPELRSTFWRHELTYEKVEQPQQARIFVYNDFY